MPAAAVASVNRNPYRPGLAASDPLTADSRTSVRRTPASRDSHRSKKKGEMISRMNSAVADVRIVLEEAGDMA